jgi:hypothetical protein
MWHINIYLTKICLYHVFFPDNLVYYFFQPRGEEIIEENTSFLHVLIRIAQCQQAYLHCL